MKRIQSWNDVSAYGIKPLTGEACGLMYRVLFDVTEHGKHVPLGIFALLESGCTEVWSNNNVLLGVEPDDPEKGVELAVVGAMRRFAYDGTAGSRNRHGISGRIR